MSNVPFSLGSNEPGSVYGRGTSAAAAVALDEPDEVVSDESEDLNLTDPPAPRRPAPQLRLIEGSLSPVPTWNDLVLTEPIPAQAVPLSEVLEGLHPDAMVSGRLLTDRSDWPSRPDVIRSAALMPQVPPDHPDYYPYSDGDNLAASTLHADALIALRDYLVTAAASLSRTYVGTDQLLYYAKGDRERALAPDIYVLTNTDIKAGDDVTSIKTWVHGVPIFVVEQVSDSSLKRDVGAKLRIYAKIGVPEYLIWDPKGDYLQSKIHYFRLANGSYKEQPLLMTEAGEPSVTLLGLPVRLICDGFLIRVQSTETGEIYRSADEERAHRLALEGTTRELQGQLEEESVRAQEAQRQTEVERERAEAAQQQAEAERERAEAAQRAVEAQRERAEAERERAEAERERAEAERERAEAAQRAVEAQRERAEAERERAEAAQRAIEAERERAEAAQRAVETERKRAEEASAREVEARLKAEAQALELANLRALLARLSPTASA